VHLSNTNETLKLREIDEEEPGKDALPMDPSLTTNSKEFKRGYLRRKSIFEQGGKKSKSPLIFELVNGYRIHEFRLGFNGDWLI